MGVQEELVRALGELESHLDASIVQQRDAELDAEYVHIQPQTSASSPTQTHPRPRPIQPCPVRIEQSERELSGAVIANLLKDNVVLDENCQLYDATVKRLVREVTTLRRKIAMLEAKLEAAMRMRGEEYQYAEMSRAGNQLSEKEEYVRHLEKELVRVQLHNNEMLKLIHEVAYGEEEDECEQMNDRSGSSGEVVGKPSDGVSAEAAGASASRKQKKAADQVGKQDLLVGASKVDTEEAGVAAELRREKAVLEEENRILREHLFEKVDFLEQVGQDLKHCSYPLMYIGSGGGNHPHGFAPPGTASCPSSRPSSDTASLPPRGSPSRKSTSSSPGGGGPHLPHHTFKVSLSSSGEEEDHGQQLLHHHHVAAASGSGGYNSNSSSACSKVRSPAAAAPGGCLAQNRYSNLAGPTLASSSSSSASASSACGSASSTSPSLAGGPSASPGSGPPGTSTATRSARGSPPGSSSGGAFIKSETHMEDILRDSRLEEQDEADDGTRARNRADGAENFLDEEADFEDDPGGDLADVGEVATSVSPSPKSVTRLQQATGGYSSPTSPNQSASLVPAGGCSGTGGRGSGGESGATTSTTPSSRGGGSSSSASATTSSAQRSLFRATSSENLCLASYNGEADDAGGENASTSFGASEPEVDTSPGIIVSTASVSTSTSCGSGPETESAAALEEQNQNRATAEPQPSGVADEKEKTPKSTVEERTQRLWRLMDHESPLGKSEFDPPSRARAAASSPKKSDDSSRLRSKEVDSAADVNTEEITDTKDHDSTGSNRETKKYDDVPHDEEDGCPRTVSAPSMIESLLDRHDPVVVARKNEAETMAEQDEEGEDIDVQVLEEDEVLDPDPTRRSTAEAEGSRELEEEHVQEASSPVAGGVEDGNIVIVNDEDHF